MPERYIPMPEVHGRIKANTATLPFSLQKNIGLDISYISFLAQLGGIRQVTLQTDNTGERSQTAVQIVGLGKDGSALAGSAKRQTVQVYSSTSYVSAADSKQEEWSDIEIKLNTNEITQTILQSNESVRNPDNWVKEINKAIKEAVRNEGKKVLIDTAPKAYDFVSLVSQFVSIAALSSIFKENLGLSIVASSFARLTIPNIRHKPEQFRNGQGYRFSLMPIYEVDRLILLQLASRLKSVAKAISN